MFTGLDKYIYICIHISINLYIYHVKVYTYTFSLRLIITIIIILIAKARPCTHVKTRSPPTPSKKVQSGTGTFSCRLYHSTASFPAGSKRTSEWMAAKELKKF